MADEDGAGAPVCVRRASVAATARATSRALACACARRTVVDAAPAPDGAHWHAEFLRLQVRVLVADLCVHVCVRA
jgi:hypothetical protein